MVPLYKPYMPPLPELNDILYSGALAYGHYTRLFEDALRDYLDEPYVMVTNTYASAVSVALFTLGVTFGDEVIASPMACLASTQPLVTHGLTVVWADVDPRTGTLSPDNVRKRITPKTKLILHNHFCGILGHIDEVNAIGKEYGIPVIDDGIEAFGGLYKGRKLGNTGTDVTIFSFNAVRLPNTVDGGAVVFKDKVMFERAILVRDAGIDRGRFRDDMREIDPSCDISIPGVSATMSNVNGYIGLCQMDKLDELIEKHRANAKAWDKYFVGNSEGQPIFQSETRVFNYWVYGVLAKNKQAWLQSFREKGYYASGVHVNNNLYSVFGKTQYDLHGVTEFYSTFLALPCGWWMENMEFI
jgi:dTDP-4-amino-4,6-dideoxygalactose transaminase